MTEPVYIGQYVCNFSHVTTAQGAIQTVRYYYYYYYY